MDAPPYVRVPPIDPGEVVDVAAKLRSPGGECTPHTPCLWTLLFIEQRTDQRFLFIRIADTYLKQPAAAVDGHYAGGWRMATEDGNFFSGPIWLV